MIVRLSQRTKIIINQGIKATTGQRIRYVIIIIRRIVSKCLIDPRLNKRLIRTIMNPLTKTSTIHLIMATDLHIMMTINLRMRTATNQITNMNMKRDLLTKTITNQLMMMITNQLMKITNHLMKITNHLTTTNRPLMKIPGRGKTLKTISNCHLTMKKILSLNRLIST
jgi:hypothetical protein